MVLGYIQAAGAVVDVADKLSGGRVDDAINSLNPFASSGEPLEVMLPAGGQLQVPHGLDRTPSGYQIICKMGQGDVWDYQAPDGNFLYLETSAGSDLPIKIQVA